MVLFHYLDPYIQPEGGDIKQAQILFEQLPINGHRITVFGVQSEYRSINTGLVRFIPVTKSGSNWVLYLIKLFFALARFPTGSESVHFAFRPYFLLPSILLEPECVRIVRPGGIPLLLFGHYHNLLAKMVKPLFEKILRNILRYIDLVIATDEQTADYYKSFMPTNRTGSVIVIPVGVNLHDFSPFNQNVSSSDRKTMIFVGRVVRDKNISFLLKVVRHLNEKGHNVNLTIVGAGDSLQRIQTLAKKLPRGEVIFKGHVDRDEMPNTIGKADVLVLSSFPRAEGSPTVVREALACGIPVVSTDVGDVRSVIEKYGAGEVVSWGVQDFSEAVVRILSHDREDLQKRCRKTAEEFDEKIIVNRVCTKIEKLAEWRARS